MKNKNNCVQNDEKKFNKKFQKIDGRIFFNNQNTLEIIVNSGKYVPTLHNKGIKLFYRKKTLSL